MISKKLDLNMKTVKQMHETMNSTTDRIPAPQLDADLCFDNQNIKVQPGVIYKEYGFV